MSKVLQIVEGKLLKAGWSATVLLPASSWTGGAPYEQSIELDGVTPNSKIDIEASAYVMNTIISENCRLLIGNDNGSVKAYAVGSRPSTDLNLQLTVTEVVKENELSTIWGNVI